MDKTIAIAGMGWLGRPLAQRFLSLGHTVKGSVTTMEKAIQLQQYGFKAYAMEITETGVNGEVAAFLNEVDVLIIMVPPGIRNLPSRQKGSVSNFVHKMRNFLSEIKTNHVRKVILVSSTSVYDDSQGRVTEADLPKPKTQSGIQLREVEELFFNAEGLKTTVVRFGGLFGGSRQPARYLAGRTDLHDGNAPVNLIHREDCLNILVRIVQQGAFGHIFNAVNPHHPTKRDYYTEKAKELDLDPPRFAETAQEETFKQVDSVTLEKVLDYSFATNL